MSREPTATGGPIDRVELGEALLASGEWAPAKSAFDRALEEGPTARALVGRALALLALGNADDGLADLNAAVALEPGSARAYHERGVVFAYLGRDREAAADLGRAVTLDPSPRILSDRGGVLVRLGIHAEGRADLRQALSHDPALGAAHLNLGISFMRTDDRHAAAAHLRQALLLGIEQAVPALKQVRQELFVAASEDGTIRLAAEAVLDATSVGDLAEILERFPFAELSNFADVLESIASVLPPADADALRERVNHLRELSRS